MHYLTTHIETSQIKLRYIRNRFLLVYYKIVQNS